LNSGCLGGVKLGALGSDLAHAVSLECEAVSVVNEAVHEISRYGTLRTWANELRLKDAVRLLGQTLQEEKNTDVTLTKIAETVEPCSRRQCRPFPAMDF
jgi:ferritin-like metal-binding protein YciE